MKYINQIIHGDCEEILKGIPRNSIDLIVTSPPYAERRKNTYGGIKADAYVDWLLPKVSQMHRVLKDSGSFILNIKEPVINGERHRFVIDLIIGMKEQGWLWTEEYVWHKKNSYPGKWPNRFRDAWERLLHFNKTREFTMYQDAVRIEIGSWADHRLNNLSETDRTRDRSKVGSGFGKKVANWKDRKLVYPTNVLHMATESANRNHSAAFPESLPTWFIKLFTEEGNVVLDPFLGSGTTAVVAKRLGRRFVGIENNIESYNIALARLEAS